MKTKELYIQNQARLKEYQKEYQDKYRKAIKEGTHLKKERVKIVGKIDLSDESIEVVPYYHTNKACPACNGRLELSRWRACLTCVPVLETDAQDDFIYNNVA